MSFLTGENDIVVPFRCVGLAPKAIPYQWWTILQEEHKKKMTEWKSKDEYWDLEKPGK